MNERLTPNNIATIGNELAIAWSDGRETYISFESLRRSCPCAACCGEPDALGNVLAPDAEGLVVADICLDMITYAKSAADPVGHYSRPDVMRLMFNQQATPRVVPFESDFDNNPL